MARPPVLDLVGPERDAGCGSPSRSSATGRRRSARIPIGTRVFIEGPYGVLTGARRTRDKVLLVAGGIGITPLRALLEALPARPGDLTLLYRVRDAREIVFRDELDTLARARGARVHYLVGGRAAAGADPLDAAALERLVPDIREHDVYVCGPVPMMERVAAALRRLGLPAGQIHQERFATDVSADSHAPLRGSAFDGSHH